MERTPFGITEEQYAIWRAETVQRLNPVQLAVFMLVENLWKLEQQTQAPGESSHEISWGRGVTTERILDDALNGDFSSLPVPDPSRFGLRYREFGWRVRNSDPQKSAALDMRIRLDGEVVVLKANLDRLRTVETEVTGLLDPIPHPMTAWDEDGFRFENAAMQAASPK